MLRRRLMKRLSKSASDISNCKKKTYSTSPEEEAIEFDPENNYGHRRARDGGDDEGTTRFTKHLSVYSHIYIRYHISYALVNLLY